MLADSVWTTDAALAQVAMQHARRVPVTRLERRALYDIAHAYQALGVLTVMERVFIESIVDKYAEQLALPVEGEGCSSRV